MKADSKEYVNKDMQEKYAAYRHNNSPDFNGAGVALNIHPAMMDLEEENQLKRFGKALDHKYPTIDSNWSNFEYSPNPYLVFSLHRTLYIRNYSWYQFRNSLIQWNPPDLMAAGSLSYREEEILS